MNVMASDLIIRNEYHCDMLIFHEKHIQSSITNLCWAPNTNEVTCPYLSTPTCY